MALTHQDSKGEKDDAGRRGQWGNWDKSAGCILCPWASPPVPQAGLYLCPRTSLVKRPRDVAERPASSPWGRHRRVRWRRAKLSLSVWYSGLPRTVWRV